MHELLIRCGQRLSMLAVRPAQIERPGCDRPILIAAGACAIALLPIQGLQATPITPADHITEISPVTQRTPASDPSFASTSDQPLSQKIVSKTAPGPAATVPLPGESIAPSLTKQTDSPVPSRLQPPLTTATEVHSELPEGFDVAQDTPPETIPFYGEAGSRRWYVQGGGATNLDSDETRNFGLAGAGISHFFLDGNSINLELNGMAFDQPGDDAVGLNLAAILRWDFIRQQNWSLYIDGGAGILGTTDSVPSDGTSFNFTPQVGGGATIRLNERNRLMVGVRWHHISNANTFDSNPGQDLIFGYVGINFPR